MKKQYYRTGTDAFRVTTTKPLNSLQSRSIHELLGGSHSRKLASFFATPIFALIDIDIDNIADANQRTSRLTLFAIRTNFHLLFGFGFTGRNFVCFTIPQKSKLSSTFLGKALKKLGISFLEYDWPVS